MTAPRTGRNLVIVTGVVIAATVAAALTVTGLPGEQRRLRLDERRISDLQEIAMAVDEHARLRGQLPATLEGLGASTHRNLSLVDPASSATYRYEVVDTRRYRLCARFERDSRRAGGVASVQGWQHAAGEHCFDRALATDIAQDGAPGGSR